MANFTLHDVNNHIIAVKKSRRTFHGVKKSRRTLHNVKKSRRTFHDVKNSRRTFRRYHEIHVIRIQINFVLRWNYNVVIDVLRWILNHVFLLGLACHRYIKVRGGTHFIDSFQNSRCQNHVVRFTKFTSYV